MKAIHGLTALAVMFGSAAWAGPEIVSGPGADPECFAPWSADTKYLQWEKKEGPYRIALVNGFVGNTWRIQMIKMAKTFAEDPSIKDKIKEFKVVSTGEDVATAGLLALAIANPIAAALVAACLVVLSLWLVVAARRMLRSVVERFNPPRSAAP